MSTPLLIDTHVLLWVLMQLCTADGALAAFPGIRVVWS